MKKIAKCLLMVTLLIGLTGCNDKINIEDLTIALIWGIDLDQQGDVVIYMASPVFSKDVKEKNEHFKVKSLSFREARDIIDSKALGITAGGKVQTVLIGRKVIEQKNWYSLLDLFYRDPKMRLNADLVVVNGSVSDVFDFSPKNKPSLSLFIPQLLKTANFRNVSVRTPLRYFYKINFEKGITPYTPELTLKDNALEVSGTILLNKQNQYRRTLSLKETMLLIILQDRKAGQLTMWLNGNKHKKNENTILNSKISFYIKNIKRNVKKKFDDGKYQFNINLKLPIAITESPIKLNDKSEGKLVKEIENELQKELNLFVKSLQNDKVDPIGLGLFARSFKYSEWKKVEDDWVGAFQQSKIKVKVKIILVDRGISM
ncbi:Ger(x)C family spore germination protein [Bacillus sp. AFS055030]|uniref:Ger(x)C family spore germination protein n=1 Tax=Bacillus sp. AFS055030 TaxID=2033507 RepID=UPI000BFD3BEB|nr:Ger(x)C family spore germination protein [Bacillus sp. AFS055030]PGL71039.1 spore gernimation protein [Bacillus sp. AFS055030]